MLTEGVLYVQAETNRSRCPWINVITEAMDWLVIGWERCFSRWLGLCEVVIKDVLWRRAAKMRLSEGLRFHRLHYDGADNTVLWQMFAPNITIMVSVDTRVDSHTALLAYKWIAWLIRGGEEAHDSILRFSRTIDKDVNFLSPPHHLISPHFRSPLYWQFQSSAPIVAQWGKSFLLSRYFDVLQHVRRSS